MGCRLPCINGRMPKKLFTQGLASLVIYSDAVIKLFAGERYRWAVISAIRFLYFAMMLVRTEGAPDPPGLATGNVFGARHCAYL